MSSATVTQNNEQPSIFDAKYWEIAMSAMRSYWQVTQKLRKFAHMSEHQITQNAPKYLDHFIIAILGASYGDEGKGKVLKFLVEMFQFKTYAEYISHLETEYEMPQDRACEITTAFVDKHGLVAAGKKTIEEMYAKFVSRLCVVIRANGGPNAGHTIYFEGEKMATHAVPSGIMYSDTVINFIARGCLVSYDQLSHELGGLVAKGMKVRLFISKDAFVITPEHVAQDKANEAKLASGEVKPGETTANGSTKSGIGPCAADKAARRGVQVGHKDWVEKFASLPGVILVDDDYLFYKELEKNGNVCYLFEGAQGFGLDPDAGQYPFVTSTSCTYSFVVGTGVNPNYDRIVAVIGKLYDTYVGALNFTASVPFDPTDPTDAPNPKSTNNVEDGPFTFDRKLMRCLVQVLHDGHEKGTTTGRWRQANFLNIRLLIEAITTNGANIWICNKGDILKELRADLRQALVIDTDLGTGELVYIDFEGDFEKMVNYINTRITIECPDIKIIYSESPEYV